MHPTAARDSVRTFGLRDRSLSVLREGYQFWDRRRREAGTEVVQTRVLGERVTCVRGPAAAELFYGHPALRRSDALPTPLVGALFGEGPVHMLDGDDHAVRKALFNDVLTPAAVGDVATDVVRRWEDHDWSRGVSQDVFTVSSRILLTAACRWTGTPDPGRHLGSRARDMLAMVDGFGSPGLRQVRARRARRRTDRWITQLVERSRREDPACDAESPFARIATHRSADGTLLPAHTAAVEIINLLRPLVAVSWLIAGAVDALHDQPQWRRGLRDGATSTVHVAQEVRRCTPFVPFLAARATEDISWSSVTVPRGSLLVLDIWGTDHDPEVWTDPNRFDPERYDHTRVTPFNLVPQGGGDRWTGHRCPGEDMALSVLVSLLPRLARIQPADDATDRGLRRMPPRPRLPVTTLD